ncbi:MAG: hypothetical protein JST17_03805 [Bacteroidetes bacterium]|nr:hypothetical protein [Bacteroidota bacterium]MBS1929534.1 hypothetical protein [Bacteroidota bacterium]
MSSKLLSGAEEMLQAVTYTPCVSIIMPFEPKMSLKSELEYRLKIAVKKVDIELLAAYPAEREKTIINRLKYLISNLDYHTHKKSIALFISPVIEKVFYLDFPVEEKIIIDDSFEIRDLVYNKKEIHKYLVLVLSAKRTRIYLGTFSTFVRIVSNLPDHVAAYLNDSPEQVSNFSDASSRKEVMLGKFLRHTDAGLSIILNAYSLPLFVIGTDRVIGHFKKITHNEKRIRGYVRGNYDDATEDELYKAIKPQIANWKKVKQQYLLQQLDAAAGSKKLVSGMENVWREAMNKKGKLLVVEKNYIYQAFPGMSPDFIYVEQNMSTKDIFIKDAVDDVIEKILENGGDVEFVDPGVLKDYEKIALILYY